MQSSLDEQASHFKSRNIIKKQALPKAQKELLGEYISENFQKVDKKKDAQNIQLIMNVLGQHFVFYKLGQTQLENIIRKMFYCQVQKGDYIFKQDSDATCFFIIENGQFELEVNGQVKKVIQSGECFGELALLYNAPRSGGLRALETSQLWAIDRKTFRSAVMEINTQEMAENRRFIERIKFFENLTTDQKDGVASVLITLKYQKGQNVVVEGDPGSSFYIIKQGVVGVYKGTKQVRKLQSGESFGEQALFFATTRTMTCRADEECMIMSLGRDVLTQILGDQVQIIVFRNIMRWALEKSQIMCQLTKIQTERVLDNMKILNYRKGDILLKKGQLVSKLFVGIDGNMLKKKDKQVVCQKGQLFGDKYLADFDVRLDDDIIIDADGNVSELSFDTLAKVLGSNVDDAINQNNNKQQKSFDQQKSRKYDVNDLSLKQLLKIKELGAGQFGKVYLVKDKLSKELFALKCISKYQILEEQLEKHLIQEKNVLEKCNHPFVLQYIRSFKDDYQIYFLLQYIRGMELFDAIREIGLLSTNDSQFYIGSMILALEYLHNQNIIYRDIKPENILVDEQGTMILIDMGTAKILDQKKGVTGRTFTIIGTPHYMAPEVITGRGYNFLVDLWSVGVCLYEFMVGRVPFGEECEDPYEIYEEIIKQPITYPSYLKDKKAKKLMQQLLNKLPEVRLGGSYTNLKSHSWFEDFDWDRLIHKEISPPYKPPQDKIISLKEIEKLEAEDELVITYIQKEIRKNNMKIPQTNGNWDKDF